MDNNPALHNWAGNVQYSSKKVYYPNSVTEVQQIVKQCRQVTALGSRHSFNRVADNAENQISLANLSKVISIDEQAQTVTIESGVRYSELAPYLHKHGYALHNMASLPHISVAGACATATHGSGLSSGNLATSVTALEFVNGSGELVTLSRDKDEDFYGAVVALGALGIVTKLTLAIQPTFMMRQVVYRNLPMQQLQDNFDSLQAIGYSVSLFTNWKNQNINEVWIISKIEEGKDAVEELDEYGLKPATEKTHPVDGQSTDPLTEQLGIPGPWFERMPHFKVGFQPSMGNELQSEYYISIEHAYQAMQAVAALYEQISPHLYISEIRTVGADNLWMSPCYKRACVTLHFTWIQHPEVVSKLIPLVEETLAPYNPVPHWGKLFTMPPGIVQSRYKKLEDFIHVANKYDPHGKFRNDFLTKNIFSK